MDDWKEEFREQFKFVILKLKEEWRKDVLKELMKGDFSESVKEQIKKVIKGGVPH